MSAPQYSLAAAAFNNRSVVSAETFLFLQSPVNGNLYIAQEILNDAIDAAKCDLQATRMLGCMSPLIVTHWLMGILPSSFYPYLPSPSSVHHIRSQQRCLRCHRTPRPWSVSTRGNQPSRISRVSINDIIPCILAQ